MKKIIRLTESDIHKIVKRSVNKILNEALDEMPTGRKIQFRNDKRDVWYKFASRIRNKNFGLCKSDQRQLGTMYAEAFYKDREDLAEKIYDYACKKQWEYGRMKSNGDEELCERLDMEMMNAFSQGEREYDNSDIWTDDDPNFNGPGGYEDSIYQFENKSYLNRIIKETINRAVNEVRLDGSNGYTYSNLHGNDPDAWQKVNRERYRRINDINKEIDNQQEEGYTDDIFGTVGDLKKERYRNIWNAARNKTHETELGGEQSALISYMHPEVDFSNPEERRNYAKNEREKLNKKRPDMSVKTKARDIEEPIRLRLNSR